VALEGAGTQYTWLTAIRRDRPVPADPPARTAHIAWITGAAEAPRVTAGGPCGRAEVFVNGLAAEYCDLAHLGARIADVPLTVLRILAPDAAARIQITLAVGETVDPGVQVVGLTWDGAPISNLAPVTVETFVRGAPRVLAVADGDLLSRDRILCGVAKLWVNNLSEPDSLRAGIGGQPMRAIDFHCEDPVDQRYQINLYLPEGGPAGMQTLEVAVADALIFSGAIDITPIDLVPQAPTEEPR
jgi:hypothetical protein